MYELVFGAVPIILDTLARYRDRLAYVVDDDAFDEKVCDVPLRALVGGRERDVHIAVWVTAYGLLSELVDELHRRRLQLTGFVPIEGGLQPDAPSCERAVRGLANQVAAGLGLADIELLGII